MILAFEVIVENEADVPEAMHNEARDQITEYFTDLIAEFPPAGIILDTPEGSELYLDFSIGGPPWEQPDRMNLI